MALAEALAESEAMTGQQPGHKPPASKHAVKALTREKLSAQRLKQLGGPDVQCSVCRWGQLLVLMLCNADFVVIAHFRCSCAQALAALPAALHRHA